MQSISANQDFLEHTGSQFTRNSAVQWGDVSQSATPETQGYISHPPLEEPVLCAKEHCEILDAQEDSPAVHSGNG